MANQHDSERLLDQVSARFINLIVQAGDGDVDRGVLQIRHKLHRTEDDERPVVVMTCGIAVKSLSSID